MRTRHKLQVWQFIPPSQRGGGHWEGFNVTRDVSNCLFLLTIIVTFYGEKGWMTYNNNT